jgi:hypothetical protein
MKNMKLIIGISMLIGSIWLSACGTTRKLNTAMEKKDTTQLVVVDPAHADSIRYIQDVYGQIQRKRIDFQTFQAKIKVDYWDNEGKGPDLTVVVRMKKDSLIWLSINATVFSYEPFRVLITPDSVKLLDRKNKEFKARSVAYLRDIAKLPLDFKTLQDVIIGNPIFLDSNVISYRKDQAEITLLSIGEFFRHQISCDQSSYRVTHSKLDEVTLIRNLTCDLTYGDYEQSGNRDFAKVRSVTVTDKTKLDIRMEVKQFSFNESLSYPFSVSKNYVER